MNHVLCPDEMLVKDREKEANGYFAVSGPAQIRRTLRESNSRAFTHWPERENWLKLLRWVCHLL